MFSVGDVEDIRWLVHVISFEEWSEGRENKSSGWERMGGLTRQSAQGACGMEEFKLRHEPS